MTFSVRNLPSEKHCWFLPIIKNNNMLCSSTKIALPQSMEGMSTVWSTVTSCLKATPTLWKQFKTHFITEPPTIVSVPYLWVVITCTLSYVFMYCFCLVSSSVAKVCILSSNIGATTAHISLALLLVNHGCRYFNALYSVKFQEFMNCSQGEPPRCKISILILPLLILHGHHL